MWFPAASSEGQFICPGGPIYVNISPDFPVGRLMPFQPIMTFGWYRSFWKHLYGMMLLNIIGSLWWVSNGDQWIPLTNGQYHRDLVLSFLSVSTNCVNVLVTEYSVASKWNAQNNILTGLFSLSQNVLWPFQNQWKLNFTYCNQNNILCM